MPYAKRKLPTFMWAGFTDGKADLLIMDAVCGPEPHQWYGVLYPTRKQARRFYKDVRKVEIRQVKG